MVLLDGTIVAKTKIDELKKKIDLLNSKPKLCIIQVGDVFESNKYITNKVKKCNEVGIDVKWKKFESNINEDFIIDFIKQNTSLFDGLIVQLPLPQHMNKQRILDAIDIKHDVDGLSTNNMNNFYQNKNDFFVPATAKAIMMLLNYYQIDLNNKNIVVVGESNLVGRPTKHLLSSYTNNISSRNINTGIFGTENADILIVAAGCPNLIKKENVKNNACVIDVGINTLGNKKIVGDVDFDDVKDKAKWISPVPGGVGPLTVIALLENVLSSFIKKSKK